jgi:nucleotide-binding universal stress UspA family protein
MVRVVYARGRAVREGLVGEALAPTRGAGAVGTDGGAPYRVVVPVANPETEGALVRLAAASAHAHEGEAEIVAVNVIEVPQQTSLEQDLQFEEERVDRQRELLDAAREIATDLDVGIRTRAIVGRNAGEVVLDVVEEEGADHVLLGWQGHWSAREHVLGSTIDPIVENAPCETTLVKLADEAAEGGDVLALAGEGPHAPVAARRAAEFVDSAWGDSLTLLNVQAPETEAEAQADAEDDAADRDPEAVGREIVEDVAEAAGLQPDEYEAGVVVSEDVEAAVLAAAADYATVCVGSTRAGAVEQALFGSLPETVGEQVDGTVAMARGAEGSPRSIREALVELLSN